MERLKRKLTLLDIPVFEIESEDEILQIAFSFFQKQGLELDEATFRMRKLRAKNSLAADRGDRSELTVLEALLAVEESAVLFVERIVFERLVGIEKNFLSSILIRERNIVDSIEVALLRISSGSVFYGQQLDVIQPENLSDKTMVFILK